MFVFYVLVISVASAFFNTKDGYFRDEFGRVRIFHGTARVTKEPPWYDVEMYNNDEVIDKLVELGYNIVRLGWMFAGFNPHEGNFNETYFEVTKTIVEKLSSRGIYVFLDVHQDLLSSLFCTYDGFPLWLVNQTQLNLKHSFPWPLKGDCYSRGWMENAFAEALGIAYQKIYDNVGGVRDYFVEFWKESAKRWKDFENIIGYELINEPFAGDILQKPWLVLPGEAGRINLMPNYDILVSAIKEIDPNHIILYEPVTWGMVFNGKISGSGFSHVPGGSQYQNQSAYSYHYYCWALNEKELKKVGCDDFLAPEIFKSVDKLISEIGGTSIITEFCGFAKTPEWIDSECSLVVNMADQHFQSWTDWGIIDGKFDPAEEYENVFSRTYARSISGTPINTNYDWKTKDYELCFNINKEITQPTEIFYNQKFYPKVIVTVTENLKYNIDTEKSLILLYYNNDVRKNNNNLGCVNVTRN